MPDGMRMMVPVDWSGLLESALFSPQAKLEYQREPLRAEELKASALDASGSSRDESVREFVIRHFGVEVADTIAAPLLAGVFGGDIAMLSARAVLPAYVALEREHGSLFLGLQHRIQARATHEPVFTTLRNGIAGLVEGMEPHIPSECIRRRFTVDAIERTDTGWYIRRASKKTSDAEESGRFDAILLATPAKTTAQLLAPHNAAIPELLPQHSSSALVVALAFSAKSVASLRIPRGFGFLVPQRSQNEPVPQNLQALAQRALLACTFVDQKFPHRTPQNAILLRVFFGGPAVPELFAENDDTLIAQAHAALGDILNVLPEPMFTVLRRWPNSLPLYAVGHLARIAELEKKVARLPHVRLIGNAYRGVGLPDLIRDGRNAVREMAATLVVASV
jgi:oxygen-dependent protoporphyrinogen oxidase